MHREAVSRRQSRRAAIRQSIVQALEPRMLLCGTDDASPLPLPAPATQTTGVTMAASTTLSPLTAIPSLNSDPGAPNTLYLDFHGEPAQQWGFYSVPATPAYDIDGDPTTFSAQELANIQQIWAAVAEAYSPFNVNVTTVDPGNWNLTGSASNNHQLRDVIGGSGSWTGVYEGGVAEIGSFYTPGIPNTSYVFSDNLGDGTPLYTADDAVHEAGHGFGLQHQSVYSGTTKISEYNTGNGSTAPFMGNPLTFGIRATWWDGQSSLGYNVIQDDVAVLTNTLGLRPENVGHTTATATALVSSNGSLSGSGIIESLSQQDYFSFTVAAAGADTFTVNVASSDPTLHAVLELHDSKNNVVAVANSAATLGQTLSANLNPGTYYLVVKSYGQYGDLGQYSVGATVVTLAAPSGLTAAATSASQVSLAWANNASNATGLVVQRSTDGTTFGTLATLAAGTSSYLDATAAAGATYWYRVYATGASGVSGNSNVASATTVPAAPASLSATAMSPTSISLAWSAVTGATGYTLQRSTDGVNWSLVAQAAAGVLAYTDTTAAASTAYYYRAYASDASGASAYSSTASVTTPALPVASGTASFVKSDTTTQGTWSGVYGADGYWLFNSATALPAYAAVTAGNQQSWTWNSSTTDPRALQTSLDSTSRLAACLYSATSFSLDVNLTDGKTHQVSIYMLDWDTNSRAQTVQVIDASTGAVYDTRSVSAFSGGQWLSWNVTGHVKINLICTGGMNAVASGIMFGAGAATNPQPTTAAATFLKSDTTTQGSWGGVYGGDGYWDFNGTSALPSYAQVSAIGASNWTWASSTTDPRALQTSSGASSRLAACDFSGTSFTLDVNLTDGQTHQVALYMLDWDTTGRAQTVQVNDASTGALLDSHSVSGFNGGQWLVWNVSGHVKITITCTGGMNAVVSGIMFGGAASGTTQPSTAASSFLKSDTTTQGSWGGVYGADGYWDFNGTSALPSYAQVSTAGASNWTWASPTTDPRALQTSPGSSTRLAACDFSGTSFTLDVNLTDGKAHQVALYMLDWDTTGRAQTVQITDASTGAVLDTRSVSNFNGGQWLVWNITGHVKITITCTAGMNAVVSGLMFGQ